MPVGLQEVLLYGTLFAFDEMIMKRKKVKLEKIKNLRFFESMDKVNRVIQGTIDLEQMMRNILDVILSIFDCDRASLFYPCDQDATSCQMIMDRSRPEYSTILVSGLKAPMDPDLILVYKTVLALDDPSGFGHGNENYISSGIARIFNEYSLLAMPIFPNIDKPYMMAIQQCSRPRVWTQEERRLLREIGIRLGNAFTNLLSFRNMRYNQDGYRMVIENSPVSIWEEDFSAVKSFFNDLKKRGHRYRSLF